MSKKNNQRSMITTGKKKEGATEALLEILALGNRQIAEGKVRSATEVLKCLRERDVNRKERRIYEEA